MILVIDVGNTHIVMGIFEQDRLLHHWRISTNRGATEDEYGVLVHRLFDMAGIDLGKIEGVMISSVVPPLMLVLEQFCLKYLRRPPLVVGPGIRTGLNIRYENPREVGADRIVNAVAALELYAAPVVIVDFGTATTFCYLDAAGNYMGGVITPGIEISTEALYEHAAKLPRIELAKPKQIIGRNTVQSMQSGIVYGYAGLVDGIVERIAAQYRTDPFVVATGGLAELIAAESKTIKTVNPLLTLQGLRILYERNR